MAGRKPTNLKVLHGGADSFAPKRDAKGEAKAEYEVPPPPIVKRNASARAAWKVITANLAKRELLDQLDRYSLALACMQWAEYVELTEFIRKNGRTYETQGRHGMQIKTRPQVAQRNDVERRLRSSFGEHGLTPLARVRLKAPEQGNLFEELQEALGS